MPSAHAAQWSRDYERDGYLVVEDCVDQRTLDGIRAKVEPILSDPDSLPSRLRRHVQTEREYRVAQGRLAEAESLQRDAVRLVMEIPLFDPLLAAFIAYEPLLDVLQALFHSTEFHFHNYKCINKAPRASGKFSWHRDLPYLYHSTPNLITAMVCLDDMTEEDGATVVLPGTHRLVDENVPETDRNIPEPALPDGVERKTLGCPAGSAVFFHVNLVHGGGPNRSSHDRRNVIGIWAGPNTYPVGPGRYAFQGLYPRSVDLHRQRQIRMALFDRPDRVSA